MTDNPLPEILPELLSPDDIRDLGPKEMGRLAQEIRDVLRKLVSSRSAHFASNLGVVELCIALHSVFDFRQDRLVWDTGHQVYPHKLLTGRYDRFETIRTKGGLMGYPNPEESEYDLFVTGHAGCSISSILGLKSGDELMGGPTRRAVAVIGDGSFASGIVYEALNHIGGLKKPVLVILNDNRMSICPRVGGLADYLDRLRGHSFYRGLKTEVVKTLGKVPLLGDPVERFLAQMKEGIRAGLHGGVFFEDLGLRYYGPIDGHNISLVQKYLNMVKDIDKPVLLHVVTEKGHGFQPAEEDPTYFHAPPILNGDDQPANGGPESVAYTDLASGAILDLMREDSRVTVMTAAMCQGNKLEKVREEFPDRFFDTGICESHAVAFAAGQAKAGMRPIVDIYSTFMQRSFDQIFQEAALQNLPVTFMMDRAGIVGPDGATHQGAYDLSYMRIFPNMVVAAPGDAGEVETMLRHAIEQDSPFSMRYPRASAASVPREPSPIETGKSEVIHWGTDGVILCCGALLPECHRAIEELREKDGLDIGLVNARFIKPMDEEIVLRSARECPFIITVEENALPGGYGAAVLETIADAGLAVRVKRLGIPDRFIEHGKRDELLSDIGLDLGGILKACRQMQDSSAQ